MSLETMLEIYKINAAAEKKYQEEHNKFLSERGITKEEFEIIVTKIISNGIDQVIRNANNYINRYC